MAEALAIVEDLPLLGLAIGDGNSTHTQSFEWFSKSLKYCPAQHIGHVQRRPVGWWLGVPGVGRREKKHDTRPGAFYRHT